MKKITIISIYYPPEQGAAATRMANLAAGLRSRGLDVRIVTALPNYPTGRIFEPYRGRFSHSETIDGIPVKRYWLYPSNSTVAFKRIFNMVSFAGVLLFCSVPHLLRHRPDIVIVNSPPLPVGLAGLLLARIVGAKAIVNVSDLWPLSALDLGAVREGLFFSLLEMLEGWMYRLADAVVSQSEETRQHVLDRQSTKPTFLYRNLERPSPFAGHHPAISARPVRIVYAGLLGVAQGVFDICRSINFASIGAEFHVYGHGNEQEKIARYVTDHPGCGIFMHRTVPKSELPAVLQRFHATIIPLKSHIRGAFPSKIYMALAASLPVLFSGAGEGAAFVRQHEIGWVSAPGDVDRLGLNIEALAAMDDRQYAALRARIRALSVEKYDLEEQLGHFVEFVTQV